jgi:hypothetical protein
MMLQHAARPGSNHGLLQHDLDPPTASSSTAWIQPKPPAALPGSTYRLQQHGLDPTTSSRSTAWIHPLPPAARPVLLLAGLEPLTACLLTGEPRCAAAAAGPPGRWGQRGRRSATVWRPVAQRGPGRLGLAGRAARARHARAPGHAGGGC